MDHLFRLIVSGLLLALLVLSPGQAQAACTESGNRLYCDTAGEAQAQAQARCGNTGAMQFYDVVRSTVANVTFNGFEYEGYWYGRELYNGDLTNYGPPSNCPYPGGIQNFYAKVAGPDPCLDAVGGTFQEWHSSSAYPPSGVGCRDFAGSSCGILFDVISAPLANSNGSFSYRALVTYTGGACDSENDEEVLEEEDAGDGWTCNPDTGLCTDPEGDGKLCTFNPDGTRSACVPHEPGDGTETPPDPSTEPGDESNDDRDNRSAGGGASCSGAPTCSGDAIDCAQLWQQWKTRCPSSSVSGAGCTNGVATNLNCTGMDSARCFELQKSHEASCRLAALDGDPGEGEGGGVDTTGMGDPNDFGDGGVDASDAWRPGVGEEGGPPGLEDFDDGGWLGGARSCPVFPVVNVLGVSLDFNFEDLCWFMGIGAKLVLLFAALSSIRIVSRVI